MNRSVAIVLLTLASVAPRPLSAQEHDYEEAIRRFEFGFSKEEETDHFSITAGEKVIESYKDFAEALLPVWQKKLGKSSELPERLKIEAVIDGEEYEKSGPKGTSFHRTGDKLLLLHDARFFHTLAAGGTELYLSHAYPNLSVRKDLPVWFLPALCEYFGTAQGKEKSVSLDSPLLPETYLSTLMIQKLIRNAKWMSLQKLLGSPEGTRTISSNLRLQGWAILYFLFNSPGESGGAGTAAKTFPDFLTALESGRPFSEAFQEVLSQIKLKGAAELDIKLKAYFQKIKAIIPDREEGEWLVGETEHYTIQVQKGATNKKFKWNDRQVLQDMKFKMELLFEKYSQAFGFESRLTRKAGMKLYKNEKAYHAAGGPYGSAAYYSPSTKELVGYEDSDDTGIVFQIFCHEGCHQFFDLAFPGFYKSEDLPMWFSEGLADCFGSSEIAGKNLLVFTLSGVATWRIETIKEAATMNEHTPIRELLDQGRMPFMSRAGLHYAEAWSFCHFLWNYPNLDQGKGVYREVLIRLIQGFKEGRPKEEVYKDAFRKGNTPLDIDALEQEWKLYIRKLSTKKAIR